MLSLHFIFFLLLCGREMGESATLLRSFSHPSEASREAKEVSLN